MKKIMAITLAVCMVFAFTVVTAGAAGTDVAAIGSATYETLADAIADSSAGDTIKLLDDVTENVTIGKNITLDGAGKMYTGKITLNKVTATIENVNFVNSQIYKNKSTGTAGTITVRNCSFEGNFDGGYAINIGGALNLNVEACAAKNIGFGFVYAPSSIDKISLKDVTIDGATYGVHIVYNNSSVFENVTMKNVMYGVMHQNYGSKTCTFVNCKVEAEMPVIIWERTGSTGVITLDMTAENDFGTGDVVYSAVQADGNAIYAGSSYSKVIKSIAELNGVRYTSLQSAIDACAAGDNTITLIDDCAETATVKQQKDINIVIDGDGKIYSGTINIDGNNRPTGAETLTIKNVKFEKTDATTYAYFINATKNGKGGNSEAHNVTVDSCSFKSNNWHYAIATRHPYNLTVKNCTAETVYYFIYNPQGGQKMTVEDCAVTKATYGIGSQKCTDVSVKNYTYAGKAAGIYGRATSNAASITMENVDITTTLNGQPAITLWKNDDGGTSATFKFIFKGENKITAPEGVIWFARQSETNSPYEFVAKCNVDTSSNIFAYVHKAAEAVVENNAAPDCVNTGSYDSVVYCSVCGEELSRENINVDALGHTAGAAATCQVPQVCTVCGEELDSVKDHKLGAYVSNNDATCQKDGTMTAECVYGCGYKETIVDSGTMKDHVDANENGECDYCACEYCKLCGKLHEDFLSNVICLVREFIRLAISFFKAVA